MSALDILNKAKLDSLLGGEETAKRWKFDFSHILMCNRSGVRREGVNVKALRQVVVSFVQDTDMAEQHTHAQPPTLQNLAPYTHSLFVCQNAIDSLPIDKTARS